MRNHFSIVRALTTLTIMAGFLLFFTSNIFAHCDSTNGPIIPEARTALDKGDVTIILKWVKKDDEAKIKEAFAKALKVRGLGKEAAEMADNYFFETLIRIHRAGEGAPFTGIKNEPPKPIVLIIDKTIEDGSADKMIEKMSGHFAKAIKEKFAKVLEAKKNKDKSVEAGRGYVALYVEYMHYVEGIHAAIMKAENHEKHAH